jgi:hypothetical protein
MNPYKNIKKHKAKQLQLLAEKGALVCEDE